MKPYKYIPLLIFVFLGPGSSAQRFTDYGLLGGITYYNGEINPTRQFYSPSPAFGGFFRVNINKRYAVRVSGLYGEIKGSDNDFPERNITDRAPTTFSNQVMDFCGQLEFNFMPYITGEDRFLNSIYAAGGLGYALFLRSRNSLTIPFGVGYKINLSRRLSMGGEWSFRKTFVTDIDDVPNQLDHTLVNNNDWYSFFGLFISYKFVKFAADCPAYK